MAHLRTHQTRTVTWGFGATFVGIDPASEEVGDVAAGPSLLLDPTAIAETLHSWSFGAQWTSESAS